MTKINNDRMLSVYDAIRTSSPLPPTIRDLMQATGISSTSVVDYYLGRLEKEGLIIRVPRAARGILLTSKKPAPSAGQG